MHLNSHVLEVPPRPGSAVDLAARAADLAAHMALKGRQIPLCTECEYYDAQTMDVGSEKDRCNHAKATLKVFDMVRGTGGTQSLCGEMRSPGFFGLFAGKCGRVGALFNKCSEKSDA